ncbi:MAG: cytochrome ubiquinol oxidase subunit I [Deferribacterota bacterium]|nr:cytochrome ubiquinol oxidase subunit I [Deferribacterota bacterium]
MEALTLARLQFAMTTIFHFFFVPLTLGLIILIAIMETIYVKTGNEMYKSMAKFWGKIFLANFAIGVVTGITLEFQFGMNWAEYSRFVGDIFGAPLAIEATVAFFLESTFLGMWIFGWDKLSKKAHLFSIWMVALGSNLSALWILIANAWMQNPVGYTLRNSRAEMIDFAAVVFSPYAWTKFIHTVLSGYTIAAFFVLGVSAYHILKKSNLEFFKKSFKMAALFGVIVTILQFFVGDWHAYEVSKVQPTKLAAMESHWETESGAPIYMFALPDEKNERNYFEILPIPKMLSLLATHKVDGVVKGLKEFPKDERPPVWPIFFSFRLMVGFGVLFILLTIMAYIYIKKDVVENKRAFLKLLLYFIPIPYIIAQLGWIVAELGRQPWIVYGLLKTSDAVSKTVSTSQVILSLTGFVVFYGALGLIGVYLMFRFSKEGPKLT